MTKSFSDRIREVFHYDPQTGDLFWAKRLSNRVNVGDKASCPSGNKGYLYVGLDGKTHLVHRVVWIYVTGDIPVSIDHIDGDKLNNRFDNLRLATDSQNKCNRVVSVKKTSKYKGVSLCKGRSKWRAQIGIEGKRYDLGRFTDEREAAEAYIFAAMELHSDFARFI